MPITPDDDVEALLNEIFAATPLPFIRHFLREQKRGVKKIKIGTAKAEVRANLRDALLAKHIGRDELEEWYRANEGWGKQHLYLATVPHRSLRHAHLLNTTNLKNYLKRKNFLADTREEVEGAVHKLTEVFVDDEVARLAWRSHVIDRQRDKNLDYQEEREAGEYEFHAYLRVPRRSASRLIIRKTDGIVVELIDLPLEDDHSALREEISSVAQSVLAPLSCTPVHLPPIITALDQGAVSTFGGGPTRKVQLNVDPTQARYRADGALVEFKSTRESSGYTANTDVRRVRQALRIQRFEGDAGKFRLAFETDDRQSHDMTISLHAADNRVYLFSRMTELEVLKLVDQLIRLRPK